jgi:cytochrome c biogenesis protein
MGEMTACCLVLMGVYPSQSKMDMAEVPDNFAMLETPQLASPAATHTNRIWRELLDTLASMRFSISVLTVICIASVIGTVVKQNEPIHHYVNQFGPFWAEIFGAVNLYTVYSAWWFLLILAFLVLSTSLCIARNTPKILGDFHNYKEGMREQTLQAFHLKGQALVAEPANAAQNRIEHLLRSSGWKLKVQARPSGVMLAARKGSSNKLGYIAAHSAIVLICVGGLLDGDLVVKAQMWFQDKTPFRGSGASSMVPSNHRLSSHTLTFRANLLVPEGQRAGTALIHTQDGVVLQELPFDVELKKFIVQYYSTGMPKLFASEILIHDKATGQATAATVEVNKPAVHSGVTIYQSSFDDGGSWVTLRGVPMVAGAMPMEIKGQIGSSTMLGKSDAQASVARESLTLEFTGLRVINVENFGNAGHEKTSGTDVRPVNFKSSFQTLQEHLGSGIKVRHQKDLRNIGPSVSYKLRDAAGQAHEFQNYMLPVQLDGHSVFLAGVRDNPTEGFKYLRLPADDQNSLEGFIRLKAALADPDQREQAVNRYVALATPEHKPEMAEQLRTTAGRTLAIFAGEPSDQADEAVLGGLPGLSRFLERSVPEVERERISEVLLRILNGCLYELLNISRRSAGLPPLVPDDNTQAFMTQAVMSLSDSFFYPAPLMFAMTDFQQVQASVFQVARAPGKNLVYFGAIALIVGVFAMLYVRERRLWVWVTSQNEGTCHITTALSATRRTLDADAEFDVLKAAILQVDLRKPAV